MAPRSEQFDANRRWDNRNWTANRDWDRWHRDHDWWRGGPGWGGVNWGWGGVGWGWGYPGYGWYGGWGRPGWGWYGYNNYPGYGGSYGYTPGYTPGYYGYAQPGYAQPAAPSYGTPPEGGQQPGQENPARQAYDQAVSQFQQKNYPEAQRLAQQAASQAGQNPTPHELLSLTFFAQGDYRQAAEHARQALQFAPPADWNTLYGFYNNLPTYTQQLDRLADFVRQNPNNADGQFLLGYQDAMMGHNNEAQQHFARAVQLNPQDQMAGRMNQYLQQGAPTTAATPSATY